MNKLKREILGRLRANRTLIGGFAGGFLLAAAAAVLYLGDRWGGNLWDAVRTPLVGIVFFSLGAGGVVRRPRRWFWGCGAMLGAAAAVGCFGLAVIVASQSALSPQLSLGLRYALMPLVAGLTCGVLVNSFTWPEERRGGSRD